MSTLPLLDVMAEALWRHDHPGGGSLPPDPGGMRSIYRAKVKAVLEAGLAHDSRLTQTRLCFSTAVAAIIEGRKL